MDCLVALCGLTARDSRLLEVVINRANSQRHQFRALQAGKTTTSPDIVIVDAGSPASLTLYQELRQQYPRLVPVTISDDGWAGDSRYRIERKSLFLHIMKVLEDLADREFSAAKAATLTATFRTAATMEAPIGVEPNIDPDLGFVTTAAGQPQPLIALVVDGSAIVRDQLRQALERLGIGCDQAENAEAAIPLLEQNSYCLVFLDVVLSGMDGFELCRWIRRNAYTRLLPLLILTSRTSQIDRSRGELSGCDAYLTKPISWKIFSEAVDQVLMKYFQNDRAQLIIRGYRS